MDVFFVNTEDGRVATRRQLAEAGLVDESELPQRPWHVLGVCESWTDDLATVRREELHAGVERLGATVIAPEGFEDQGPFDVVLELVGAPNLPGNLQALATDGRIAVIGVGAGAKAELNLLFLMGKRARIHGSTLRARPLEQKAIAMRLVEHEVLPLFEAGALEVPLAATLPLDEAEEAYERFSAGGKLGKIVLLA